MDVQEIMRSFKELDLRVQSLVVGGIFCIIYGLYLFFYMGWEGTPAIIDAVLGAAIFTVAYYGSSALLIRSGRQGKLTKGKGRRKSG